jgi:outer membrane protein assembly factor BamB
MRLLLRGNIVFCALITLAGIALPSGAQDWPQWRGPNRDGVVPVAAAGIVWPAQLTQKWQASVGSGHSSPLISGGNVFVHTRRAEEEVVSCFDLNSGKSIWSDRYPAPYMLNPAAASHGKGPKSTPALQDGRLYTLGISGVLSCHDAATGRVLWRKEFRSQFRNDSPLYGTAMSPIIDGNLVIAHVGGNDGGAIVALDRVTGQPKWTWDGDGPAYASPIVTDLYGTRQLVTQTQQNIVGLAVADGQLLWKIPFTTPYVQNIVTPVRYRDLLIFSGLDQGVMAVKITRSGNTWKTEKAWENTEASFYMSSPVVYRDSLVGLSHKKRGQYVTLDARTGRLLWGSQGRDAGNAAILIAGDAILSLNDSAELLVFRMAGSALEPVRRYTVARSASWAHPAISGKFIVIKDTENLLAWSVD